jgi:hypothetical protein
MLDKILRFMYCSIVVLGFIFLVLPIKSNKHPKAGEIWEECLNENNPFEPPYCRQYEILDVKKHPKAERPYVLYKEKDRLYNYSADVLLFEDYKCVENCK